MKEITKAYRCDYCGKVSAGKSAMARHEECCRKNPKNISLCANCKYLQKEEEWVVHEDMGIRVRETHFICTERGVNLFHPKILRKSQHLQDAIIAGQDAEVMPTIFNPCPHFKLYYE